jgi:NADPH-dependent curcumin reductase CurA
VPGLIVTKRLTMRGFLVSDFYQKREQALADLKGWVDSGKLKVHDDVMQGLDQLPAALIGLLAGDNRGKRMVKVV